MMVGGEEKRRWSLHPGLPWRTLIQVFVSIKSAGAKGSAPSLLHIRRQTRFLSGTAHTTCTSCLQQLKRHRISMNGVADDRRRLDLSVSEANVHVILLPFSVTQY